MLAVAKAMLAGWLGGWRVWVVWATPHHACMHHDPSACPASSHTRTPALMVHREGTQARLGLRPDHGTRWRPYWDSVRIQLGEILGSRLQDEGCRPRHEK